MRPFSFAAGVLALGSLSLLHCSSEGSQSLARDGDRPDDDRTCTGGTKIKCVLGLITCEKPCN